MNGKIRHWGYFATLTACFVLAGSHSALAQEYDPILRAAPLAPERMSPQDRRSTSDIKPEDGFVDYLIYSSVNWTDGPPPIFHLKIPDHFFRKNPNKIVQTWNLFMVAQYSLPLGAIVPLSVGAVSCPYSKCSSQISLLIGNRFSSNNHYNYREEVAKIFYKNAVEDIYKNIEFSKERDNDDIIYERYKNDATKVINSNYYIRKNEKNIIEFTARCTTDTAVLLCDAYTSTKKWPGLIIDYNFSFHLMPHWQEIEKVVQDTVDGWVDGILTAEEGKATMTR